jgi:outer membrane lipoprotein LolB
MMKRWTVILGSALLAGCVNTTPPPQQTANFQTQNPQQRQTQLAQVTSWDASGALSVQRSGQSPVIMRFDWHQQGPDQYQIRLAASLNVAEMTITGQPNRVTLQSDNKPPVSAATPEELMHKALGWSLPVPSLWYWVRGMPAPGASQGAQYDNYGHLVSIQQNGWQVKLSDFHTVNGVELPQVIELQRQGLMAKIVIKSWATRK